MPLNSHCTLATDEDMLSSELRKAADRSEDNMGRDGRDAVRVTTTLTRQQHAELERLAARNGVAVAWLVRRATERLIEEAQGGPLLLLEMPGGRDAA